MVDDDRGDDIDFDDDDDIIVFIVVFAKAVGDL